MTLMSEVLVSNEQRGKTNLDHEGRKRGIHMNLLLLGNGFDLSHGLPTKYENFLHVVNFLVKYYNEEMDTVGSVLGNEKLHEEDAYIKKCYQRYDKGYDITPLPTDRIQLLIERAKTNMWFLYLSETFDQDLGWIDFEKEILSVINTFALFLSSCQPEFALEQSIEDESMQFIIMKFDFFHERDEGRYMPSVYSERIVKSRFCYEYPKGSGVNKVNKEKVIDQMWFALSELSEMLKEYLHLFVDETLDYLLCQYLIPQNTEYLNTSRIITFNYTKVFEKLYGNGTVLHIHGQIDEKIVLGVNPDQADELETVDTLFLPFKKYYQRVRYGTDLGYLQFLNGINMTRRYDNGIMLIVVGHSLDVTDKDIITELFSLSNEIHILYHNERAIGTYIQNLVKIYGKRGFDELRSKKNLRFLPLKDLFAPSN